MVRKCNGWSVVVIVYGRNQRTAIGKFTSYWYYPTMSRDMKQLLTKSTKIERSYVAGSKMAGSD